MRATAPATHKIITFLHCRQCMNEVSLHNIHQTTEMQITPKDYARYEFGYTQWGMQVWCLRHECNIIHIDYEGRKFFANIKATDYDDKTLH